MPRASARQKGGEENRMGKGEMLNATPGEFGSKKGELGEKCTVKKCAVCTGSKCDAIGSEWRGESDGGERAERNGEKHRARRNRAGQLDDYADPIRRKSLAEEGGRYRQASKRATYG